MTRSEIEQFLNNWLKGDGKVFWYKDYGWFDTEVLVIFKMREDLYSVDEVKSTVYDGPFTREQMEWLINKRLLIHREFVSIDKDFREERNGGCTCGAWRTTNPDKHAFGCKKYRGY